MVSEVGQTDISVLPPLHMESEHTDWWLLGLEAGDSGGSAQTFSDAENKLRGQRSARCLQLTVLYLVLRSCQEMRTLMVSSPTE